MRARLFLNAVLKLLLGMAAVFATVFLPAGTVWFKNGIIFCAVLFVPMLISGTVMMAKNPSLLKKRLNMKEKRKKQGAIVKISAVMFIVGFIVSGLNFRFGWHTLPDWVVTAAAVIYVAAYIGYAEVLRENAYLSRTVEIQDGQRLIDNGLYSVVRHPMYAMTVVMYLAMPLILGCVIAFVIFLLYPVIIILRIKDEEKLLEKELAGYVEYMERVKYRLIPFIW